jgi:hypothetical protein
VPYNKPATCQTLGWFRRGEGPAGRVRHGIVIDPASLLAGFSDDSEYQISGSGNF